MDDPSLPKSLKLVVEGDLLACLDGTTCKETDTHEAVDKPFLGCAVGFAGMVGKTCEAAFLGRIDDLVRNSGQKIRRERGREGPERVIKKNTGRGE